MPFCVLIVDDDADTRENVSDILSLDGYHIETAGTARDALREREWNQCGAIILDRRLPDGTAEELLPRLRELAPNAEVIIVTGSSDVQATIAAFRLGAADYVLKPIDADELRTRLRRIAEHHRAREELRVANEARERALAELRTKSEEVRAMTQQLWQAARLAGVGELAASIAHELNNPLGTISLRLEGVLAKTPADDPQRRALEIIDQEVHRMARLVGNLLNFSRAGREQVSTVDVCEEVRKTVELTEHHMRRHRVQVEPEFAPDVPPIYADRQHLRQVFLNLFTNAVDAMPSGGRLMPRVKPGRLPPDRPAVVVEVADTGVGIAPEHLPHVFEPFYTTKPEGKGTGLGLAICKRIVHQHHGTLEIDSAPGRGTIVRVTIPVRNGTNVDRLR